MANELVSLKSARACPALLPALILAAGDAAAFVWDEFFTAGIRNPHTRRAYTHAVTRFLAWAAAEGHELAHLTPGMVGGYLGSPARHYPYQKAAFGRPTRLL